MQGLFVTLCLYSFINTNYAIKVECEKVSCFIVIFTWIIGNHVANKITHHERKDNVKSSCIEHELKADKTAGKWCEIRRIHIVSNSCVLWSQRPTLTAVWDCHWHGSGLNGSQWIPDSCLLEFSRALFAFIQLWSCQWCGHLAKNHSALLARCSNFFKVQKTQV